MTGLDTNVLARYYVDDAGDREAVRQREEARRLVESGRSLMVCKTVVLELEWVLRGFYGFDRGEVGTVLRHLLSMPTVMVEDRQAVEQALAMVEKGLDFADALHHASYAHCTGVATFDDKGFARRAKRLKVSPPVGLPG